MKEAWIQVAYIGNGWENDTVYIDPSTETAKVHHSKCTHWGYHDESDWDEEDRFVSIEEALAIVYPDEGAISAILSHTKKDYSATIKQLANKK